MCFSMDIQIESICCKAHQCVEFFNEKSPCFDIIFITIGKCLWMEEENMFSNYFQVSLAYPRLMNLTIYIDKKFSVQNLRKSMLKHPKVFESKFFKTITVLLTDSFFN